MEKFLSLALKFTCLLLAGGASLHAADEPPPHAATQQTNRSTSTSTRRVDRLLGKLYPGGDAAAGGGLPGTIVPPEHAAPQPSPPTNKEAELPTRMIIRRPASNTSSSTEMEPPPVDLALLTQTSDSTPTLRPAVQALPPQLRPEATPQPILITTATPEVIKPPTTDAMQGTTTTQASASTHEEPARIRINHATEAELVEGLGIDARRARYIIEFRSIYGPYQSPEDLDQVTGLPDDMVRRWEEKNLLSFD